MYRPSADADRTFPRFRNSGSVTEKPIATGSRVCAARSAIRLMFAVVELLAEYKELNPSEIARAVGRSVHRMSTVLGALRLPEVVR